MQWHDHAVTRRQSDHLTCLLDLHIYTAYRNWKRRGYKIMSNGILTYYDLKTEGEKGTFNISKIKIINGPIENIWEIDSDGVPAETAVAVNVHSYDEMRTLEVVFFTRKDVKIFCGLLLQASVTHNIKEFQEEFDFKLADGEATDMSAPTLPEYCTVLEGVFLKLGHVRKGWKRRKFRIRKCTNYVGSNAKPGLLECGANLGSTSGSVVSSVILGNIVVRLDEDLCKGSTAVVVTSPESSLNVSVALDTTIQRRLKDVSVILFTDGLRAAGEEGEIVDPTVLSSSKNKKGEAGKDHQFTISPQIMHFLAALKDACVSSNIEVFNYFILNLFMVMMIFYFCGLGHHSSETEANGNILHEPGVVSDHSSLCQQRF